MFSLLCTQKQRLYRKKVKKWSVKPVYLYQHQNCEIVISANKSAQKINK